VVNLIKSSVRSLLETHELLQTTVLLIFPLSWRYFFLEFSAFGQREIRQIEIVSVPKPHAVATYKSMDATLADCTPHRMEKNCEIHAQADLQPGKSQRYLLGRRLAGSLSRSGSRTRIVRFVFTRVTTKNKQTPRHESASEL
jgi:hypothetical protein